MSQRVDSFEKPIWLLQPADAIAEVFVDELMKERVFQMIFGESHAAYMRSDWSTREMPALRAFTPSGSKQGETGYMLGDLQVECIFPPLVRREQLQRYPDIVISALIAQLRRPSFFNACRKRIPALNRLGFDLSWDKALAYKYDDGASDLAPLAKMTVNWRVNLNEWDKWAEDQGRTVDQPFEVTLEDLTSMTATIVALRDNGATALTVTQSGPILGE